MLGIKFFHSSQTKSLRGELVFEQAAELLFGSVAQLHKYVQHCCIYKRDILNVYTHTPQPLVEW